ncbi:MAG TPA: replication-relaxation family protein [Gaiellaceae bacterium]|nr:replication-relaxation family protein [Gaiellaceae bacterium]
MNNQAGRPRADERLIAEAQRRLTERDRTIFEAVYEHRVLTSEQLRQLFFVGGQRARQRLVELYRLRMLDRFRPYQQHGSAPYHYLLDQLGAAAVATERGLEPAELDWSRAKALKLASSKQLDHLVEANGFFTSLIEATRTRGGIEIIAWWGQRRCAQAWGELVRPDGYGAMESDGAVVELYLEWDRGSEALSRIEDKLIRYGELEAALGRRPRVVFVAPSDGRERELLRVLREHAASDTLITTADRHTTDPLGTNWLSPHHETRLNLIHAAQEPPR